MLTLLSLRTTPNTNNVTLDQCALTVLSAKQSRTALLQGKCHKKAGPKKGRHHDTQPTPNVCVRACVCVCVCVCFEATTTRR
jgi:hypothetical protein